MRILFMLPAAKGVYPEEAAERRIKLIKSYATPSVQIDVDYMPEVSGFNPFGGDGGTPESAGRAHALAVQRLLQAEAEGYDAFLPFGGLDIGVRQGRQVAKRILTFGPGEAAMRICGMIGRPFATISYESTHGPGGQHEKARQLGVEHLLTYVTAVELPNSLYPTHREELKERFIGCVERAREHGAELVGMTGMSICPLEFSAAEWTAIGGMPVLDPIACQVSMAETWHRLGQPLGLLRWDD